MKNGSDIEISKNRQRQYIAIDLKSYYSSVECRKRELDPMKTNLVVADPTRTEKTICLAVSPSLKAYGISGRARLFEVVQRVKEINAERRMKHPYNRPGKSSVDADELAVHPEYDVDYIVAPPHMAEYLSMSTKIYEIYLEYVAQEDMVVYSVDEVFIDVTEYLETYKMTAKELAGKMIKTVFERTGITATAGVGTNLYLCKVAMDVMAKHAKPDENGTRIAELTERSYREKLWEHRPITDFWRVGPGYAKKLAEKGMYTMGDIAQCSMGGPREYFNEELLYKMFGVNAELLIDHAWGWEPCTIADIKSYKPENNSLSSGQVLHIPYTFEKARIVVYEMTDALSLELVDKGLVTDQLVLTVGYDIENVKERRVYGTIKTDRYGRSVPKHAHGTANLKFYTASSKMMLEAMLKLYDDIVNPNYTVRRLTVVANHVLLEEQAPKPSAVGQMTLFTDYEAVEKEREAEQKELEKEKRLQKAMLEVKKKYGKNAMLKGVNFEEGATARERNKQIGGHKA